MNSNNGVEEILNKEANKEVVAKIGTCILEDEIKMLVQNGGGEYIIVKVEELDRWVVGKAKKHGVDPNALAEITRALLYKKADETLHKRLISEPPRIIKSP
jgi:hypothetical protein